MTSHSAPITRTSSRLDRSTHHNDELAAIEYAFSREIVGHCELVLDRSRFFHALAGGRIDEAAMQYAFTQYRFFRDQLHRWFGLCILKAPTCRNAHHKAAIMALADHVFTDLRDSHEEMYDAFLRALGLDDATIDADGPGLVTRRYSDSFLHDFASGTGDFFFALAALAGRELCVSLRNQRFIDHYFTPRGQVPPEWIALHAHVELDHFHDAIRPVLAAGHDQAAAYVAAGSAVRRAVDAHVRLFDDLLLERADVVSQRPVT
jgi:thiaminase